MIKNKLPYDKFLESFKLAPRIAIDLWIRNEKGQVLYKKRLDEPFQGYWHLPGSFILLGETVKQCIARVASEEVGLSANVKEPKLLWLDEDLHEPRGHVIHLVYLLHAASGDIKVSEKMKFYFEPPQKLIPSHREIFLNVS